MLTAFELPPVTVSRSSYPAHKLILLEAHQVPSPHSFVKPKSYRTRSIRSWRTCTKVGPAHPDMICSSVCERHLRIFNFQFIWRHVRTPFFSHFGCAYALQGARRSINLHCQTAVATANNPRHLHWRQPPAPIFFLYLFENFTNIPLSSIFKVI